MMVQHEDRRVTLAQISKRDGRILAEIDLGRDKEPVYQVDDISSFVFYNPSGLRRRGLSVLAGARRGRAPVAARSAGFRLAPRPARCIDAARGAAFA